jgi:hypothetical protein
MYLEYTPEGQPTQRWTFQPGRVHSGDMILIEKHTGLKYGQEFKQALLQGGTLARRGLLWLFLHRDHPTIKFDDVSFYDDELKLVQDKDEIDAEIDALEKFDGIPEDQRAAGLAMLRSQLETAPAAPGKAPASTPAERVSLQFGGLTAPEDASTGQDSPDPSST